MRFEGMPNTSPLAIDDAAHVVQLALTPIFLLTGIASLLNVFSTRLGRIADQVDKLDSADNPSPGRLARLRIRSRALDIAVLLAAIAGALTCAAALTLFFGEIRLAVAGRVLFGLFGGALACSVAALAAFSLEIVLAGRTVRDDTKDGCD
jgi:MFS family permease